LVNRIPDNVRVTGLKDGHGFVYTPQICERKSDPEEMRKLEKQEEAE